MTALSLGSFNVLVVRRGQAENFCAFRHTMVHAVVAGPHSVSLVIRGPAAVTGSLS
jgi:hypothetical protein